ncbi:MAG TPA: hypothetical protein VD789_05000 [Thermomicrobiales bacterium]|nr:hypothetical protein [Thermomicrobiales bacterium]
MHKRELWRFLRVIGMDLRHGHGFWLVPLLIVAGCLYFVRRDEPTTVLWGYRSVHLSWTFAILGPIGAAWGAWLAGRERRSRTESLLASIPTSSLVRDVLVLAVPVLGVLVAYSGIAAFVLGRTLLEATWGGPVWSVIVYGAWVSAGYTVVGTILGLLVPARPTTVIAGIGSLLFTTLTYTFLDSNSAYSYFAPFRWVSDLGAYDNVLYHDDRAHGQLMIAFALVLGVVLAAFGVLLFVRFGRASGVLVGVVAAMVLVPSIDAVIAPPGTAQGYRVAALADIEVGPRGPVENPPLVCGGDVVETCLHKAYEHDLLAISDHTDAILAPVIGLPGVPARFEQRADAESTDEIVRFTHTWQWGDAEHVIERAVTEHLFSSRDAPDRGDRPPSQTPAEAAIGMWLIRQAGGVGFSPHQIVGYEPPFAGGTASEAEIAAWQNELAAINQEISAAAERFAALSPGDQRAWLETNWDALRSGELTLEDMP